MKLLREDCLCRLTEWSRSRVAMNQAMALESDLRQVMILQPVEFMVK